MTNLDRRQFFRRTSWAAGVVVLPGWLARGFHPQDGQESARQRELRVANQRAIARGKPLLLFVVPAEQRLFWERGELLGMFLNHCSRDAVLDLALCEPACATLEELRGTLQTGDLAGDPLMVLIEHEPRRGGKGEARVRPVPIAPEFDPDWPPLFPGPLGGVDGREEPFARKRIAAIAAALHDAVAPDRAALAARADQCRSQVTTDDQDELTAWFAGGEPPAHAVLLRNAAIVRMAALAPRKEGDDERLLAALARAVRALLIEPPLPGSKWARPTGCGVDIEGEAEGNAGVACGMGRVPPLARRMLYFFTAS